MDGFERLAESEKKLKRMINQAKLKTYHFWKMWCTYPSKPCTVELDKANRNTKWQDAEVTERSRLLEYNTFVDKVLSSAAAPSGYKKN
jgi:hypothetical protein